MQTKDVKAVNEIIDGESIRPCDNCWPDKELTNQQEAGAMGTGTNRKLEGPKARKVQDQKNAGGWPPKSTTLGPLPSLHRF
jgi:hypothetical protein